MTTDFLAQLVPELKVSNLAASLRFWCDLLGFAVRYGRPEEGFAFLDLNGAQIMLDQRGLGSPERRGLWETGTMDYPSAAGSISRFRLWAYRRFLGDSRQQA